MATVPGNCRYTDSHEWVRLENGIATVGITDYAQEQLSDVVYVELPQVGRHVETGEVCAVVESSKIASDVYAPMAGEIIEVNTALESAPERVNQDPFNSGWFFKLRPSNPAEYDALLDKDAYVACCATEQH